MIAAGRPTRSVLFVATLALPVAVSAETTRLGPEFRANSYTLSAQSDPAVAVDGTGAFVIVWHSQGQDGNLYGVFGRRFSSTGSPLASELQINTFFTSNQREPAITIRPGGEFLVVWESYRQDGLHYGIFARRFASDGTGLATELQINSSTDNIQRHPAVAADGDGDFVVVWQSWYQDHGGYGVFARRFASDGTGLAIEFQVNITTVNYQHFPAVAAADDGDFVVVWRSLNQDGQSGGIFARRFASDGAGLATELQVNSYTANSQHDPAVTASADGDFVIVWASATQDGGDYGVFGRRFSSAGDLLASELQINSYTTNVQRGPAVTADAEGGFVVAWRSTNQDGAGDGVFARAFSSAGDPLATELQVNTHSTNSQNQPSLAANASGQIVVVWRSLNQDGSSYGVFAQRFGVPPALDIDANGAAEPLIDGLLVLRYLFGFRGATLVGGAIDLLGCARCDAPSIETYIAALESTLDIDGNGSVEPLTDGLLVLRYLFGFRGATLVTGVIDLGGCSRCNADDIESYLATLV